MKKREEGLTSKLAGLLGMIGFISVILYAINPNWVAFASLSFPIWLRWTGVGMALLGFVLLQCAQAALGKSWSDQPRMMKEQTLITSGPYRAIRHPIYTGVLLVMLGVVLRSPGWWPLLGWVVLFVILLGKARWEERMLSVRFEDYPGSMKRTGRFLPRIRSRG